MLLLYYCSYLLLTIDLKMLTDHLVLLYNFMMDWSKLGLFGETSWINSSLKISEYKQY